MHQFGWLSERAGGLFKFLSERGGTQKGRGFPQKRGGGSNPGGNYVLKKQKVFFKKCFISKLEPLNQAIKLFY